MDACLNSGTRPKVVMLAVETSLSDWVRLIRAEYDEMPGLVLTCAQIKRMWGIDSDVCCRAMDRLVEDRFVIRRSDGSYARPSDMHIVELP
jgi:hypothetical protein